MPEPNVLFTVTAVVVAGLFLWVAWVLKSAREPWTRPEAAEAYANASRTPDVSIEEVPPVEPIAPSAEAAPPTAGTKDETETKT